MVEKWQEQTNKITEGALIHLAYIIMSYPYWKYVCIN